MSSRSNRETRKQRTFALLPILCIGFLLVLLSACGSNADQSSTGSSGVTATPTTLGAQKCGTINVSGPRMVPTDSAQAKQGSNCFYQAYQQCHPALLTFRTSSVDSGIIHTFTVKQVNGKCTITDLTQHYVVPKSPQGATPHNCSGAALKADGVHVTCDNEGDVVIPIS
jgi:hypothetical protein